MFEFHLTPKSLLLAPLLLRCCPFSAIARSSYNIHKQRLYRAEGLLPTACVLILEGCYLMAEVIPPADG